MIIVSYKYCKKQIDFGTLTLLASLAKRWKMYRKFFKYFSVLQYYYKIQLLSLVQCPSQHLSNELDDYFMILFIIDILFLTFYF